MSRSIHQNSSRRYARKYGSHGFSDWAERIKKREIKRFVKLSRDSPEETFAALDPEAIHYSVEELRPPLFYPATLEDVKAVMAELPPGYLNGVHQVSFLIGREYINAQGSIDDGELDPFSGRKSVELEPGLHAPIVLGTYHPRTCDIQLFAYAQDPSVELNEISELALKLKMLETLVHELVHHQRTAQHGTRGRWRMDDVEKEEDHADKLTRELFYSVVIPYAHRVYGPDASGE
ncbi:MAG: hypothetical protein AAF533_19015 [Acidobacteriota bacterium]